MRRNNNRVSNFIGKSSIKYLVPSLKVTEKRIENVINYVTFEYDPIFGLRSVIKQEIKWIEKGYF